MGGNYHTVWKQSILRMGSVLMSSYKPSKRYEGKAGCSSWIEIGVPTIEVCGRSPPLQRCPIRRLNPRNRYSSSAKLRRYGTQTPAIFREIGRVPAFYAGGRCVACVSAHFVSA